MSVPIKWSELTDELTSDYFTIENLPHRLAKLRKDPWAGIDSTKQSITAAMLKQLGLRKINPVENQSWLQNDAEQSLAQSFGQAGEANFASVWFLSKFRP